MKKYIIFGGIILLLLIALGVVGKLASNNIAEKDRAINNYKAEVLNKEGENRVLQLTMDELRWKWSQDSTNRQKRIDSLLKANNIKDKQVRQLQHTLQEIQLADTVVFRDTIFREGIDIDTTLYKPTVTVNLQFRYPNFTSFDAKVTNEHDVAFADQKETVNPPKKFFLARWFQRKQIVVKAVVSDSSPAVESAENEFIYIIKK